MNLTVVPPSSAPVAAAAGVAKNVEDSQYKTLLDAVSASVLNSINGDNIIFTTDATGLFDLFLSKLPVSRRQHYNCNACRKFVEEFGGLVYYPTVSHRKPVLAFNLDVTPTSVVWARAITAGSLLSFFTPALTAVAHAVASAKVTGVYIPSSRHMGTNTSGGFHHLYARLPASCVWRSKTQTAKQREAELLESARTLKAALTSYSVNEIVGAERFLSLVARPDLIRTRLVYATQAKKLERSTRLGHAALYLALAAVAPAGFTSIRSSVLGSLLDDIAAKFTDGDVVRRFNEKTDPTAYQRPTAAPTAGNIQRGDTLIEKLKLTSALRRRRAVLSDLQFIWTPTTTPPPRNKKGVLAAALAVPPSSPTMQFLTLTKAAFINKLSSFRSISLRMGYTMPWIGFTTACLKSAKPLLVWDNPKQRNPVGLYTYASWSMAMSFGINDRVAEVVGVTTHPSRYFGAPVVERFGDCYTLVVKGARDTRNVGSGLFPVFLRQELHEVRSAIEAFSTQTPMEDHPRSDEHACGVMLYDGMQLDVCENSGTRYTITLT